MWLPLAAGLEGCGEVVPSGRLAGTTGIDEAGGQSKGARSLLATGTEIQATSIHPVAQQTFVGVVGERHAGSSSGWTIASQSFSISPQISPSFAKERCGWSSLQVLS